MFYDVDAKNQNENDETARRVDVCGRSGICSDGWPRAASLTPRGTRCDLCCSCCLCLWDVETTRRVAAWSAPSASLASIADAASARPTRAWSRRRRRQITAATACTALTDRRLLWRWRATGCGYAVVGIDASRPQKPPTLAAMLQRLSSLPSFNHAESNELVISARMRRHRLIAMRGSQPGACSRDKTGPGAHPLRALFCLGEGGDQGSRLLGWVMLP